jgi:hypothetical protein
MTDQRPPFCALCGNYHRPLDKHGRFRPGWGTPEMRQRLREEAARDGDLDNRDGGEAT